MKNKNWQSFYFTSIDQVPIQHIIETTEEQYPVVEEEIEGHLYKQRTFMI
jgi:hypothetical protein